MSITLRRAQTISNGVTLRGRPTGVALIGIDWNTTQDGSDDPTFGWQITNGGRNIRFIMVADNNGCNSINEQVGTATATLTTGDFAYYFDPVLSGMGEAQDGGFELMDLYLSGGSFDNTQLVHAESAGGGLGCNPGVPVIIETLLSGPHLLEARTAYTFNLDFTTGDSGFNGPDMYYTCELNFTYAN